MSKSDGSLPAAQQVICAPSNGRLERIARFVQDRLHEAAVRLQIPNADVAYRWQHTLRVSNYGRRLAEAEGANVEWVVAGCLLHDVAVFEPGDWHDHGRLGAAIIRPFIETIGYPPQAVENISYSVAVHADVAFEGMATLEAVLVSEADNIDRFGAYRVMLWCLDERNEYDNLIAKLRQRIETLLRYRERGVLKSPTGRALFDRQLDLQIAFFEALIAEEGLTLLPKLEG